MWYHIVVIISVLLSWALPFRLWFWSSYCTN